MLVFLLFQHLNKVWINILMIVLTVQLCCSQTGPFVNLIHFIILLYFIHINVLLTTLLQEMKEQTSSITN